MSKKLRFLVAVTILIGAVAYLMYTGVTRTAVYYLTIQEFEGRKQALEGEGVRVAGRVAVGSVQRRMTANGEELRFELGDFSSEGNSGSRLLVHYTGVVPDMFRDEGGSDVIVEGRYEGGVLKAQSVLTSCPSKYEPLDESAQMPAN
jgi:cytochrome c-type biogenesis protein CcmE